MIVLDSSALVEMLLMTEVGAMLLDRLDGSGPIHAPGLIDVETSSVLRRLVHKGIVSPRRAEDAIDSLGEFPLVRWEHTQLIARAWSLRENLSSYDAMYVALAELLNADLITLDRGIRGSAGHQARVPRFE